jgi:hypothetical protein
MNAPKGATMIVVAVCAALAFAVPANATVRSYSYRPMDPSAVISVNPVDAGVSVDVVSWSD